MKWFNVVSDDISQTTNASLLTDVIAERKAF